MRERQPDDERVERTQEWMRQRRDAGAAGLTEEDRQELVEQVEQRVGSEEKGRGRTFSKDQLVHEAAIMAREMYGSPQYSLDMENYGEQDESKGYYDLVECWEIASHRLDLQYHSEFLKWATPLSWGSRFNRYMIPNYYVFGMRGVERAIKEEYISPLRGHKLKFRTLVKVSLPFVLAGPPVAYFDWVPFGMTKGEAQAHAEIYEEGTPTAIEQQQDDIQYLKHEVNKYKDEFMRLENKAQYYKKKMKEADTEAEREDFRARKENAEERMNDTKEKLDRAYKKYEELKSQRGDEVAGG